MMAQPWPDPSWEPDDIDELRRLPLERGAADRSRAVPQRQADQLLRMTPGRKDRAGTGWLALLALPVVCCVGRAALLALAAGSLTAGAGAAAGSALAAAIGVALIAAAAVAVLLRHRRRRRRRT